LRPERVRDLGPGQAVRRGPDRLSPDAGAGARAARRLSPRSRPSRPRPRRAAGQHPGRVSGPRASRRAATALDRAGSRPTGRGMRSRRARARARATVRARGRRPGPGQGPPPTRARMRCAAPDRSSIHLRRPSSQAGRSTCGQGSAYSVAPAPPEDVAQRRPVARDSVRDAVRKLRGPICARGLRRPSGRGRPGATTAGSRDGGRRSDREGHPAPAGTSAVGGMCRTELPWYRGGAARSTGGPP
jgi:hypothetical protein